MVVFVYLKRSKIGKARGGINIQRGMLPWLHHVRTHHVRTHSSLLPCVVAARRHGHE